MRQFTQRIEKLKAKAKQQEERKPRTIEEELMRLNEIISHFHDGHSWLELPFEDQKRILVKWNRLPILEKWDFRIADNPDKELHLALEVTSLFLRGIHTLLNQVREAEEKGDSALFWK